MLDFKFSVNRLLYMAGFHHHLTLAGPPWIIIQGVILCWKGTEQRFLIELAIRFGPLFISYHITISTSGILDTLYSDFMVETCRKTVDLSPTRVAILNDLPLLTSSNSTPLRPSKSNLLSRNHETTTGKQKFRPFYSDRSAKIDQTTSEVHTVVPARLMAFLNPFQLILACVAASTPYVLQLRIYSERKEISIDKDIGR
jgi:hypothetical protein